jgi:hypothetical protein
MGLTRAQQAALYYASKRRREANAEPPPEPEPEPEGDD